jgi:1-phosphatidylinositol-4-phosphate 5-kinase
MRGDELKTFLSMIEGYHSYLVTNRESLLARIYGVYTIKMSHIKPVHLVLMQNCMSILEQGSFIKVFDLKGSTFKREVKDEEGLKILKDLNLL